jgi:hypothetical protein
MDFLQKHFYGVFELPLPRNAQKRTKKKSQEQKKSDGGWVGLGFSKCTGHFFWPASRLFWGICLRHFFVLFFVVCAQGALQKKRRASTWLVGS